MRIGYLGPEGTFSEQAARTSPEAGSASLVGLPSIHGTVMAVQEGTVELGVAPIENSVEGTVAITLDTLVGEATDVTIVGEVVVEVTQCLVARSAVDFGDVVRVVSHPQASGQCAGYLRANFPGVPVTAASSTADAVRQVVAADEPWVALSSRRAADVHGGVVLAEGVEDEPGNVTRFVWLSRSGAPPAATGRFKTSLAFWGPGDNSPGWLVRCLSEFAFRGVNLTKIESRPERGRLGHYRFFVDCEGAAGDPAVTAAIQALEGHCSEVRTLGSYPVAG